uniref:Uncharacterized protein n=1 Tax=Astyanax mexicanus TaxID=7994 RepID=A0A8B9J4T1_ASTMX
MFSGYQEREEYEDELYHVEDEEDCSLSELDSELEFQLYSQLHYGAEDQNNQENRDKQQGNADSGSSQRRTWFTLKKLLFLGFLLQAKFPGSRTYFCWEKTWRMVQWFANGLRTRTSVKQQCLSINTLLDEGPKNTLWKKSGEGPFLLWQYCTPLNKVKFLKAWQPSKCHIISLNRRGCTAVVNTVHAKEPSILEVPPRMNVC